MKLYIAFIFSLKVYYDIIVEIDVGKKTREQKVTYKYLH